MTQVLVTHATFTIERKFAATSDRVFRAFADPEMKARWFTGPNTWTMLAREQDFRVGGREKLHGRFETGKEPLYTAQYHQISDGERIVYTYDMYIDGEHLSVSLATIELAAEGRATHMRYTEQAAYFNAPDGHVHREEGTRTLFDNVARIVEG